MLSISQVERDTGLSKDTLRIWERRYGFPKPGRDSRGERQYDATQLQRLRLIKRLIDSGKRPGKLVGKSLVELTRLSAEQARGADAGSAGDAREGHGEFIELLQARDGEALRLRLAQTLMRKGLQQFVLNTLAPLNQSVGEAWGRGDLATFEEHLYTEQVQTLLRSVIQGTAHGSGTRRPRVLLTTLPQEQHALGLLMVESLLAAESVQCLSLGTRTPLDDIVAATAALRADIVALSFSASFPLRAAIAGIAALRREVSPEIAVWIGGRLTARLKQVPAGVRRFTSLDEVASAVAEWRRAVSP
jgi:methanogenic corrinoid protein MtbC1